MTDYKVIADEEGNGQEVAVLLKIGELRDDEGNIINYEHETKTFLPNEIIPGDKISPIVVNDYERNDEHVRSLIVAVDEDRPGKPRRVRKPAAEKE